jgi:hypothetical protein
MKCERKWNSADDSGVKECCPAPEDTTNKVMGRAVKEWTVLAEHREREGGREVLLGEPFTALSLSLGY